MRSQPIGQLSGYSTWRCLCPQTAGRPGARLRPAALFSLFWFSTASRNWCLPSFSPSPRQQLIPAVLEFQHRPRCLGIFFWEWSWLLLPFPEIKHTAEITLRYSGQLQVLNYKPLCKLQCTCMDKFWETTMNYQLFAQNFFLFPKPINATKFQHFCAKLLSISPMTSWIFIEQNICLCPQFVKLCSKSLFRAL